MSWLYRMALIGPIAAASALAPAAHAEERIAPVASPVHPMDGLTADEIRAGVDVLRGAGKLDDAARIVSFTLDENPKDEVRAWRVGQPFARKAIATLLAGGELYEARIDLAAKSLVKWDEVADRQAAITIDEIMSASGLPKQDPRWIAAMAL